jgi:hypothetical protein
VRSNIQHPTYKAFAELGRAVKTIFLCQYLHSEALRREINEGLNIVEQWNSANDFIFFARRGEMVSNRREDHEISMLVLHLLQNCMVYINTLMLQQVLAQPHWPGKLTTRDLGALTPLIWEYVNPMAASSSIWRLGCASIDSKWPLVTRLLLVWTAPDGIDVPE